MTGLKVQEVNVYIQKIVKEDKKEVVQAAVAETAEIEE